MLIKILNYMNERYNVLQIMAEIGINHKGSVKLVKKLIKCFKKVEQML